MVKHIFLLFLSPINIVNLQWIQSFWTYYPEFFCFFEIWILYICNGYRHFLKKYSKSNQKQDQQKGSKNIQKIFKNIKKNFGDFKSDKYCKFAMDTAILDLIIVFFLVKKNKFYIFAMDTVIFFKNIQKVTTK